jgi:hypothetical protein
MKTARESGMNVKRGFRSIRGEIIAHALKGWDHQTNPMDIEMTPSRYSWFYNFPGYVHLKDIK